MSLLRRGQTSDKYTDDRRQLLFLSSHTTTKTVRTGYDFWGKFWRQPAIWNIFKSFANLPKIEYQLNMTPLIVYVV